MASCKYNPGINSVNPYAVLNVTQQSQNVSTNKTIVRYELLLYRPSAISSSASKAYSITINGTKVKSGNTTIGGSGTKTIASGTLEIPHNSDGTKSISFSFSLTFDITWHGKWVGTGNASGSMTLSTIPRATTPQLSPSSVTLGSTISISLPRASSSFTHTLQHDFYVGSWTTFATGATTSATLVTQESWASKIPNGISGTGRIRCLTYNGSTLIGEKIVNFTASVPSGAVPIINRLSISEAVSNIAYKFGGYVQNKSQLKIDVDASGVQGATIKSYKVTVDGVTYSNQSFTSSVLTSSGRIQVVATVTDSRGMTASKTAEIDVMSYEPPRIDMFTVERGTSTSVPDAEGTYALMHINLTISSVGGRNDNSYTIEYKANDETSWRRVGTYSGYTYNGTRNGGNILNEESAYSFRLTVTDYFGSVTAEVDNISTAFTLFNINKSGQSMCFGGISDRKPEEKVIDFKIDTFDRFGARINNGMARYTGSGDRAIDPDTTTDELILTDLKTPNGKFMYITTVFYIDKSETANRAQTAIPYNANDSMYYRYFSGGVWSKWRRNINEDELSLKLYSQQLVTPANNSCSIFSSSVYASKCAVSAKVEFKMNVAINVMNEIQVMSIVNPDYCPKTLLLFPLIEYNYGSLSTLLIYPDGKINVLIPKGGAINSNFPVGQKLSARFNYNI